MSTSDAIPARLPILACRQIGTISLDSVKRLEDGKEVLSARAAAIFKSIQVVRFFDEKRSVLVYDLQRPDHRRRYRESHQHRTATMNGHQAGRRCPDFRFMPPVGGSCDD